MSTWSIARDGEDEPTLWSYRSWDDPRPVAIAQRCATHPVLWALAEALVADTAAGRDLRLDVATALDARPQSPDAARAAEGW
jgi:hypothetical protein